MQKFTTENDAKNNVIKHTFQNGYIVETHLKTKISYKILRGVFDRFSIDGMTVEDYFKILNKIADENTNNKG